MLESDSRMEGALLLLRRIGVVAACGVSKLEEGFGGVVACVVEGNRWA